MFSWFKPKPTLCRCHAHQELLTSESLSRDTNDIRKALYELKVIEYISGVALSWGATPTPEFTNSYTCRLCNRSFNKVFIYPTKYAVTKWKFYDNEGWPLLNGIRMPIKLAAPIRLTQ